MNVSCVYLAERNSVKWEMDTLTAVYIRDYAVEVGVRDELNSAPGFRRTFRFRSAACPFVAACVGHLWKEWPFFGNE